ncbi:MAG: phosphoglycerate kinase [Candidatus Paceibacterota bacterium]
MNLPTLKDIKDIKGKKVLLRLDLNVPIKDNKVENDYRIRKSLRTIKFLVDGGAKIIAVSHIDHTENSLKVVADHLGHQFNVDFVSDLFGEEEQKRFQVMIEGEIIICENIRNYEGEEKNDEEFSKKLAGLADIYVNEAFSVSHRNHASIVGVTKFLPHYAGFQFEEEVNKLSEAFNPSHPFLFILGGIKFETKVPLLEKFLKSADMVFVCGALANDFFKIQGYETGKSKVSSKQFDFKKMLDTQKISIPNDVRVKNDQGVFVKLPSEVLKDDTIVDAGPETLLKFKDMISKSAFILWNGPLGAYEDGFSEGTEGVAKLIAERGVVSIVGGGDTLASIEKLGIEDKFSFVSTAGGAMLDFLANETLPGIEALKS